MALKHFKGSVPTAAGVEWTCPSCQAKQQGRLELGCTACGAGKPSEATAPDVRKFTAATVVAANPESHNAFDRWYTGSEEGRDAAWKAFLAGAAWATDVKTAPASNAPTVASVGGTVSPEAVATSMGRHHLILDIPGGFDARNLTATEEATILAALAFYRDNQLVYGAVPGQLTSDQLTELITQLSPTADEVPA